jgi:D-xylulose reductase
MKFAANPPYTHGTLSKYYKMPADCCYKILTNLEKPFGLDEAVLIEPLAVAVHSVRQVGVQPGDKVVIFGAGTIGLLCAAVAREYGASLITSVDISRKKLDFAQSFVSDGRVKFTTVIPDSSLPAEENAKALYATQLGSASEADVPGFDVAIEATGAEPCIQMAIHALRVGGSFVQTGLGNPNVNFPITVVSMNEITVKGCFRYGPGDYKMALDLALMGKIDLRSLITKVLPFEKVTGAWETTRRGEGIKTLIRGVGFSEDGKQES